MEEDGGRSILRQGCTVASPEFDGLLYGMPETPPGGGAGLLRQVLRPRKATVYTPEL